jgi:hypothetical protein
MAALGMRDAIEVEAPSHGGVMAGFGFASGRVASSAGVAGSGSAAWAAA